MIRVSCTVYQLVICGYHLDHNYFIILKNSDSLLLASLPNNNFLMNVAYDAVLLK